MINADSIVQRFMRYVRCGSESKNEREMCLLMEEELRGLGFHVERDEVGEKCGSNGWNIYARMEGGDAEPLLLCAHMDTVPPGEGVNPVIDGNVIRSAGDTILGADDKSAMAAILEAVSLLKEQGRAPKRTVELLFTVCEEIGMLGAKFADYSKIKSRQGLVLDAGDVGMIINRTPAFYFLSVNITGKAAHAGVSPELGIHALKAAADAVASIEVGRVDDISVMNISNFISPGRTNVVAEKASFDMEFRSFNEKRMYAHIDAAKEKIRIACERYGASFEASGFQTVGACDVSEDSPLMTEVTAVLEQMGIAPDVRLSYGPCDAAWLYGNGVNAVNVGTGMAKVHSTEEYIEIDQLVKAGEFVLHLLM